MLFLALHAHLPTYYTVHYTQSDVLRDQSMLQVVSGSASKGMFDHSPGSDIP